MFSPDMMAMAMEQMNRMTPEQARLQMSMRQMQQMAANMDPAQMAQMQGMMNNMSPEQMRQMQQQAGGMGGMGGAPPQPPPPRPQQPAVQQPPDSRLSKAQALKEAGNKLHATGSYEAASVKYNQARRALGDEASADGKALVKACLLNLASCGLKLQRHADVVQYTGDVLASDPNNIKALYRRGQALLAQGEAAKAVPDLQKAVQLSSGDDAAAMQEVLDGARAQLPAGAADASTAEGGNSVTIEDITDSEAAPAPPPAPAPHPASASQPSMPHNFDASQMTMAADMMKNMKDNPGMMSMMENMIGNMSQEQLDAMTAATGQPRITTQQAKAQVAALKGMSPEQLASVSQQNFTPGQVASPTDLAKTAEMLQAHPELMQQSLNMMRGMAPDQLQAAAEAAGAPPDFFSSERVEQLAAQAASMTPGQIQEAARVAAAAHASQAGSAPPPRPAPSAPAAAPDAADAAPASSAAPAAAAAAPASAPAMPPGAPAGMEAMFSNSEMMANMSSMMANLTPEDMQRMSAMAGSFGSGVPGAGGTPELSADMMSKLATPEMLDTMQRMMKGMDPEALSSMMSQSGMNVTPQQAASMQQQLDKLSPKQMQWLMAAASWTQRAYSAAQRAKAWLAARPLVMAAIAVLLLALLLRRLGWV